MLKTSSWWACRDSSCGPNPLHICFISRKEKEKNSIVKGKKCKPKAKNQKWILAEPRVCQPKLRDCSHRRADWCDWQVTADRWAYWPEEEILCPSKNHWRTLHECWANDKVMIMSGDKEGTRQPAGLRISGTSLFPWSEDIQGPGQMDTSCELQA